MTQVEDGQHHGGTVAPRNGSAAQDIRDGATSPDLAAGLAPILVELLDGALRDIRWFRTDWQRGGASTAKATLDTDNGPTEVIVKIPVGNAELQWTRRLQNQNGQLPIVPRLFASDDTLAGYDLAWIVIERLPYGPLGARWTDNAVQRIARAAAHFYDAAREVPVDRCPLREDWDDLFAKARKAVKDNAMPRQQSWKTAIKNVRGHLDRLVDIWRERPCHEWIHGDLHPANAMSRGDGDDDEVTLIDLAEVRPGHWIEDAVYLERLLWTAPDRLKKHKPIREIARARKHLGLDVDEDYNRLAFVRRTLLAATAPRFLKTEGSPAHLDACLARLEQAQHEFKQYGI